MRTVVERILEAGVMAPSGDNCQPWRFEVTDDTIDVFLIPTRDQSLYSWGNRASYVAHGALIENIAIASGPLGMACDIRELPDPDNLLHTAHITLTPSTPKEHPLTVAIAKRCSNRKPYKALGLTDAQRTQLTQAGGNKVHLIEDSARRKALAYALASNEKVLFENRAMHAFFFDHMLWSSITSAPHALGFPVGALELPPPVRFVWPALRHWPLMKALTSLGFANAIVFGNTPIYASGAALASFTLPDRSERAYLDSGRTLQRLWLTATRLGLSAQILTGIPLLMNAVLENNTALSSDHCALIRARYQAIESILNTDEPIAFFLRIGTSAPPSARTPRTKPLIV